MATRRRVGFSTSASEASRRQLMQPVPVWEKVWALPDNAMPGSTLKVFKWIKTDKKQQFSDDEGELTDQPLAPLPEPEEVEVEGVEGDEELDVDEPATPIAPDVSTMSREVSEPAAPKDESKPSTPKPHPLSISFQPPTPTPGPDDTDALDDSLRPSGDLAPTVGEGLDAAMTLDMSQIGPDGEPFEDVQDLSQMQGEDALLGGALLDQEMSDPFAVPLPQP